MNFVDQNIIEIVFAELCKNFRTRHVLHSGKHIFTIMLGMTATPERTDGANIFELFGNNVAYEIRLQKAVW